MSTPAFDIIYISDDECDTLSQKQKPSKVRTIPTSYSGGVLIKVKHTNTTSSGRELRFRRELFQFLDFVKKSEPSLAPVLTTNSYLTRKVGFACVCDICRNDCEEDGYHFMYPTSTMGRFGVFSLYDEKLQNPVEVCDYCYNIWVHEVKQSECKLDVRVPYTPTRYLFSGTGESARWSFVTVKHVNLYIAMNTEQQ